MGIVRCPPWILPLFAHTLCCPNQIDDDQSGNVDFHNSDSDIMIDVLGEIFMKLELDQTLMIGMYTKKKQVLRILTSPLLSTSTSVFS